MGRLISLEEEALQVFEELASYGLEKKVKVPYPISVKKSKGGNIIEACSAEHNKRIKAQLKINIKEGMYKPYLIVENLKKSNETEVKGYGIMMLDEKPLFQNRKRWYPMTTEILTKLCDICYELLDEKIRS